MKTNFYVFRHGETDYNQQERCQGCRCDRLLTAKGEEQAKRLGQELQKIGLDCIYSSPLLRAVQTANHVSQSNGKIPVIIMQDLKEGDFGTAEGMSIGDLERLFPRLLSEFLHPTWKNWDVRFPEGESKHQMFERAYDAFRYIAEASKGKNVGISLHAGLISALACGMELWNVCYDNCAVLHLVYDDENNRFYQKL